MANVYRAKFNKNQYVIVEYTDLLGFGMFVEIGYSEKTHSDYCLVEIPVKKARKLAKAILKATKKKGKK